MTSLLNRYWLTFDPPLAVSRLGVGVTAYSLEDALSLLSAKLPHQNLGEPATAAENFEFSELDQGHVVPNMHPITERGVWFPMLGYH